MILKLLPSFLIVIGWFIVYGLGRMGKSKDDRLKRIDGINNILDDIELMAVEYHTELKNENKIRINLQLTNVSRDIYSLVKKNKKVDFALMQYRKAITLNNFDYDSVVQDPNSELIRNIGETKQYLIDLIKK